MPKVGGRVGIGDVAAAAGVSTTTVSHVLSGNRPVRASTRAQVEAAIRKLGYRPDPSARSLRIQRTENVALVVPDITNPFFPQLAAGMQDILHPEGYLISVSDAALPVRSLDAVVQHLLDRRMDGIVMAPHFATPMHHTRIAESGAKLVRLSGSIDDGLGDIVRSDDTAGVAGVVRHLVERGYRRIAFINGEVTAEPGRLRIAGYRRGLSEAGLDYDEDLVKTETFTRDGGMNGAQSLLRRGARQPDAIVCANDLIAVGAMDALRRRGLSIPGDIALTGYDDIEAAALLSPSLTTVHNPAREIGRSCARLLLDRLADGYDGPPRDVVLPNRLIPRESS
ncbi:LacI family DNA-binding transcriptional regulator [Nocardiopsis sediminis]|uniref:LacI family DNA-binding transcriptional regulator n=1 Tax=Nocardiopsis sediminis TaxID=1778267 RepID=A0ABV8FIT0_9ACTN